MTDDAPDATEQSIPSSVRKAEAEAKVAERKAGEFVPYDDLRKLASRWRSRSEIFGEEDAVARRTAQLCADELEELIGDD